MGEFQRSPSKVWWMAAHHHGRSNSLEYWRHNVTTASSSPGSQDSGFSDTEQSTSPHTTPPNINNNNNLTANVKEKAAPAKSIKLNLIYESADQMYYLPQTPVRRVFTSSRSAPTKLPSTSSSTTTTNGKSNNALRVSRNLFAADQYASDDARRYVDHNNVSISGSNSDASSNSVNLSAPAVLDQSCSSSDSEEFECLPAPMHTSTPKSGGCGQREVKLHRLHAMNLLQKYKDERVPPMVINSIEEGTAVAKWISDIKQQCDLEFMTTLQCKSIAGDLHEKVTKLAINATKQLNSLLHYNDLISKEFDSIKNQKSLDLASISTLQTLIKTYQKQSTLRAQLLNVDLSTLTSKTIAELHVEWHAIYRSALAEHIEHLIAGLEDPHSELDVRVKLTALTSITLRHVDLIEPCVEQRAVQVIATLCEKCEGSSVRSLALRALTTLCVNAATIRKLESVDGVNLIVEGIVDDGRPEPERIEAVALLAQITAPWIEDNHNVDGLHLHIKQLIKHITKLIVTSRCCQNTLLCAAALANLTGIESSSIKHVLRQDSVKALLKTIKVHGSGISVYLLEQLACLIANMSSLHEARSALTLDGAPTALIYFLRTTSNDIAALKRLQQKVMIGLTRLCAQRDGAQQVVDVGGVAKLVALCKDRNERHDSDGILVAALTTLRKITESCGMSVVDEEIAQELIKPRLMDSFMAYSSQSESLV